MTNYNDTFDTLTGGGADSLDGIAVATLSDGDCAYGMISGLYHPYNYVAASAESEVSPYFIIPDDNASGTGAWVLGGFQGAMSHFAAKTNTVQSIANSTATEMIYEDEEYDTLNEHNISTGRFTAAYAGYYSVKASISSATTSWTDGEYLRILLYKNGARYAVGQVHAASGSTTQGFMSQLSISVYLAATDYISIYGQQNSGASININALSDYNYFTVDKLI